MHQLCNRAQARRAESASQRSRGATLACVGIDQCGGNRLLDGIKKQPPTWKPCNSFSIYRPDQRSQPHVNYFAPVAEFNRATYSLASSCQRSIGNAEEQTLLLAGSNPSFHTTREKSHCARLECYSSHCGTLPANLNAARPQHHTENMLLLHLHMWVSDQRKHIHLYSHSLYDSFWTIGCFDRHEESARF